MKEVWVYDLEVWENFHSATFLSLDGEIKQFYIYNNEEVLREYIEFLETRVSGLIGFNNVNYDYPIIHYILTNKSRLLNLTAFEITSEIFRESQRIINTKYSSIRPKEVLIPQLDLYLIHHFDNKNKATSLKYVEINTRFDNVEDLPFDPDYLVGREDIDKIMEYNLNDVQATYHFYLLTTDDIEMRKMLRKEFKFGIDFLNYNDPKIGEQIFAKEISKALGISMWDLRKMGTERGVIRLRDVILPIINFRSREFNRLVDKFNNTVITNTNKPFEYNVIYKGFKYDYGVGGIHGCIEPGVYEADDEYLIYDIDIDGMYPKTGILFGFYPEHLGTAFCNIYERMYNTRMVAKKKCKVDRNDKSAAAINSGLKLALNGVYGKSNEEYSFLYDPKYTMQITVNGQLLLSMLAERLADINDLVMLQVNTDGVTVKIHKDKEQEFLRICKQWEEETGYTLEYAQYKKMVIRDVNNYLAQYTNGDLKHKGIFEIIRKQNGKVAYNKNWSMRVVPKALEKYFIEGTPIEESVRNNTDIYDFCIAQKFPGAWQGEYTKIVDGQEVKQVFKKNLRYYISTNGSYLWKINTEKSERNAGRLNVGFLATPFNKFEEKEDYNINYNFYISECNKILEVIENKQLKLF